MYKPIEAFCLLDPTAQTACRVPAVAVSPGSGLGRPVRRVVSFDDIAVPTTGQPRLAVERVDGEGVDSSTTARRADSASRPAEDTAQDFSSVVVGDHEAGSTVSATRYVIIVFAALATCGTLPDVSGASIKRSSTRRLLRSDYQHRRPPPC